MRHVVVAPEPEEPIVALYEHRDVTDTPVGRTSTVAHTRRFSPGQLLSGAVGVVLLVFGIIAVTRCGIDSTLNRPPTEILGLTHSALIGLIEIGAGLLLVLSAADVSMRPLAGIVGVLLFIGGIIVAAGTNEMLLRLGTERSTGWFVMILGAIAVLGAMLPTFTHSRRETSQEVV